MPRNTKDTKKPESQPEATPLNLLIRLLKWAVGLATAGMLALLTSIDATVDFQTVIDEAVTE